MNLTPAGFSPALSPDAIAAEQASFIRKVYGWMAAGLCATALAAVGVASSQTAIELILGNPFVFYGLIVGELAMVFGFVALVQRMSANGAAALFFAYAIVNGLTMSVIFLRFTAALIGLTFFVTAGTFGVMSAIGFVTKKDLSGVGSFMMMGLIGLILASIVNVFMQNPMIYWATTFMGILIFVGLTAYDTQKIKRLNIIGNAGTDEDQKEAIHGALILYLDFVNLFLYLLRLFGRRR